MWIWIIVGAIAIALLFAIRARRQIIQRSAILNFKPRSPEWFQLFGLVTGMSLIGIAAAGPRWDGPQNVSIASGRDLMLVMDVSRSMLTRDAFPDRFDRAKETALAIVDQLAQRGGSRIGIIAFAGQPITLCPLTYDLDFVRGRLVDLNFDELMETRPATAVSGTRIGSAIAYALEQLKSKSGELLLLSDGDDPAHDGEWARGADAAAQLQTPIHVVGIGNAEYETAVPGVDAKSRLQEGPLRELAGRTKGTYFPARLQRLDPTTVIRELWKQPVDESATAVSQPPARPWWFLGCGIVMMVLGLGLSGGTKINRRDAEKNSRWLSLCPLCLCGSILISSAHLTDRYIHRGNDELAANRPEKALDWYDKAVERTPDPGHVAFNQGVALATLHRYRDAEIHFHRSLSDAQGDRRIKALYNLGTCLIRRGVGRDRKALQDAVTALEQSLSLTTENDTHRADIETNLKIARDLFAQAPRDADSSQAGPDQAQEPSSPDAKSSSNERRDGGVSAKAKAQKMAMKGKAPKSGKANETQAKPPPGKGNLPPIPDTDVLEPMLPDDLADHLNRAAERITAARRDQLKSRLPTKPPSYPDW